MRSALPLAAAFFAACSAVEAAPRNATPATFDCIGPFGREARHNDVVAAFGQRNVALRSVDAGEGAKVDATVVHPNNKARRVEITWNDAQARRRPATITVRKGSAWRIANGIGVGTPLERVEAINGRPFMLAGFDWDYGGTVTDWQGGALAKRPGACRLMLRFEPRRRTNADVSGDRDFSSADKAMRAAAPAVYEMILSFDE
jgi:hypothetical protein